MLAMHRSGLKLSLRSWVLAQGLTSAQGKFARSRNQRGIITLCATCQRENPVLSTSCSPCVHMKWRARIQIYINKLFNWFFFSLLSFVMNPAEFQSSAVCLQSMSIFTPTDGFSFSIYPEPFFFRNGHLKYLIVKPFVLNWQPHAVSASIILLWHLFSHLLNQLRTSTLRKLTLPKNWMVFSWFISVNWNMEVEEEQEGSPWWQGAVGFVRLWCETKAWELTSTACLWSLLRMQCEIKYYLWQKTNKYAFDVNLGKSSSKIIALSH